MVSTIHPEAMSALDFRGFNELGPMNPRDSGGTSKFTEPIEFRDWRLLVMNYYYSFFPAQDAKSTLQSLRSREGVRARGRK